MEGFERQIAIGGKDIDSNFEGQLRESFKDLEDKGKESLEGEIEKTEQQIIAIRLANSLLRKEMEGLGLEYGKEIEPSRFHILSDEGWEKEYPDPDSRTAGHYRRGYEAIHLKRSKLSDIVLFTQTLHELIHLKSYRKIQVNREEISLDFQRQGYHIYTSNEDADQILRGLDEALTQSVVQEIWRNNREEIDEQMGFTDEEFQELKRTNIYYLYIGIMNTVIEKIAVAESVSFEEVWTQFKLGLFEGKMMHLRKIERVFGPGSLKIISKLGNGEIDKDDLICDYFFAEGEEERAAIREKLRDI